MNKVLLIAPFCADPRSIWFSPGRVRKLNQVMDILEGLGYCTHILNTSPDPLKLDHTVVFNPFAGHRRLLPRLKALLQLVFSYLLSLKEIQSYRLVWVYNSRLFEALPALVLSLGFAQRHLVVQLEDLPGSRAQNSGTLTFALERLLLWLLQRRSALLTCVSPVVEKSIQRDGLQRFYPPPVVLFPPLLDSALVAGSALRAEPFTGPLITVVYAGGADPEKGLVDLLTVFSKLPDHYQLQLYGPCSPEQIGVSPDRKNVCWYGYVPMASLFNALLSADVVVNPHRPIRQQQGIFPFKTAELLGSGALALSRRTPGLEWFEFPEACIYDRPEQLQRLLLEAPSIYKANRDSLAQAHANCMRICSAEAVQQQLATVLNIQHFPNSSVY